MTRKAACLTSLAVGALCVAGAILGSRADAFLAGVTLTFAFVDGLEWWVHGPEKR